MTATQTKAAPKSEAVDGIDLIIDSLGDQADKLAEAAERILGDAEHPGDIDARDRRILRLAGIIGIDQEVDEGLELRRAWSRVNRVHRLMVEAGTDSDYEASRAALLAATERRNIEGPKITAKIERFQGELQALETAFTTADAEVARMTTAREQLVDPKLLPEGQVDRFHDRLRALKGSTLNADKRALESRLSHLQTTLATTDENELVEYCKRQGLTDCITDRAGGHAMRLNGPAWNRKREELQSELDDTRQKLAAVEKAYAVEMEEARQPLRYYVERLAS